ncbi:hypothetical protein ACWDYJ_13315 [Streptomyces sp. NPDC003042]
MRVPGKSSPARILLAASAAFTLALSAAASASASASVSASALAPQNPVADAAGQYCAIDLTAQKKACFTSEQALTAHGSTLASLPLVAVYNWINYNQAGGYSIWYGDHACTATTTDVDYMLPDLAGEKYDNNNPSGISENNTYSSVSTYIAQSCDIKLFDSANYGGSSSPWIDRCTHLGGSGTGNCPSTNWYDRAGSFQLS